jgi:hypothetical protein
MGDAMAFHETPAGVGGTASLRTRCVLCFASLYAIEYNDVKRRCLERAPAGGCSYFCCRALLRTLKEAELALCSTRGDSRHFIPPASVPSPPRESVSDSVGAVAPGVVPTDKALRMNATEIAKTRGVGPASVHRRCDERRPVLHAESPHCKLKSPFGASERKGGRFGSHHL